MIPMFAKPKKQSITAKEKYLARFAQAQLYRARNNNTIVCNATNESGSYSNLLGSEKDTQKRRLQAIVTYKRRRSGAALKNKSAEEDDIEDEEDDNITGDLAVIFDESFVNASNMSAPSSIVTELSVSVPLPVSATEDSSLQHEMYTPSRISWGVYPRPANFSKAFGGGRIVGIAAEPSPVVQTYSGSDGQFKVKSSTIYTTPEFEREKQHAAEITDALQRARNLMLEPLQNITTWYTGRGSEVRLELAMTLETVQRGEEAKEIYARLAEVSWSPKIRRSALQLRAGLEAMERLNKTDANLPPPLPGVADMDLDKVSKALEAGLRNVNSAWSDEDENRKKYASYAKWYDTGDNLNYEYETMRKEVHSLHDAYSVLLRHLLAKQASKSARVPQELLRQALLQFHNAPASELASLARKNRGSVKLTTAMASNAFSAVLWVVS